MGWVSLAQFDNDKIDIVDADGVKGYIITQHWTAWVPFWICAPVVTLACAYGIWAAKQHHLLAVTGTAAIWSALGAAFVLWLVVHVDLIWYWKLANTYLLVTEKNIFASRMEHWFFNVIDAHPLEECRIETHSASWILPGVRSVQLTVEGQTMMQMKRAAGGNDINHAIETLRGSH